MPLRIKKKIERQTPAAGSFIAGQTLQFDVPLINGEAFVALYMRLHGTMTVGVADVTSLQPGSLERMIRSLRLYAQYRDTGGDTAVRSYTARGISDLVTARTASYAGRMLALEALLDGRTPVQSTDPGLTVGAQAFDIQFPLRFERPGTFNPLRTMIGAHELRDMRLELGLGILDTTAAGDDTDVFVTAATTTVVTALNVDLVAEVVQGVSLDSRFDIRKTRTVTTNLSVNDALEQELGEAAYYRRVLMACSDADVLSDARISDVAVQVNKWQNVIDARWAELQGDAKNRYGIAAWTAGYNLVDFRGILDTARANKVDLRLNVPAGAVVADDRLFSLVEELVPRRGRGVGRAVARGRR